MSKLSRHLFGTAPGLAFGMVLTAASPGFAQTAAQPAAPAPAAPAAPAPAAAAAGGCAGLAALQARRADIDKVTSLLRDGLAPATTLNSLYSDTADEMDTALAGADYDAACYRSIAAEVTAMDAADGDDASPAASVGSTLSSSIAKSCEKQTTVEGIKTCLSDTVASVADGTYPEGYLLRVLRALPIETVKPDDAQTREILEYVKGEVAAERMMTSQQGDLTKRLLGL